MRLGNRGQMGPAGEDIWYFATATIAVALVLIISFKVFADRQTQSATVGGYSAAQIYADKAASEMAWAYKDPVSKTDSSSKRMRVLDNEKIKNLDAIGPKICAGCCICVSNKKSAVDKCYGGNTCKVVTADPKTAADSVKAVTATSDIPVSIRVSSIEFDPGLIRVTVVG